MQGRTGSQPGASSGDELSCACQPPQPQALWPWPCCALRHWRMSAAATVVPNIVCEPPDPQHRFSRLCLEVNWLQCSATPSTTGLAGCCGWVMAYQYLIELPAGFWGSFNRCQLKLYGFSLMFSTHHSPIPPCLPTTWSELPRRG